MSFRPYNLSDIEHWLELLNLARESRLTRVQFEAREKMFPPTDFRRRLLFGPSTKPVAIGQLDYSPYIPADYLSALIVVAETARQRGVGSAMLQRLRQVARENAYSGLTCDLKETDSDGLAWVRRRGFRNHVRRFESELDLTRFDVKTFQVDVDRLARRSILISAVDEKATPWAEVIPFFQERVAESPDLENMTPWDLERCRMILQANPNGRADWIAVARRGRNLLGIAVMHRLGRDAYIYFVGVTRDERGQRIAPTLLSFLAGRAVADGCRFLKIDNMDSNASALRVNEQFGFVRKPGRIELRSHFDQ